MTNPQALPYAETVKSHMLITLVQKGLQLCELEQRLKVTICTFQIAMLCVGLD